MISLSQSLGRRGAAVLLAAASMGVTGVAVDPALASVRGAQPAASSDYKWPRSTHRHKRSRLPVRVSYVLASGQAVAADPATDQKRVCAYDVNSTTGLSAFATLIGRKVVDCALVYTGSPDWGGWVNPWFLTDSEPDYQWGGWVRSSPASDRRQLIISQPLLPSNLGDANWRSEGAAGDFTGYAREFAQNLVDDGVGDAIIRLSWEANGMASLDNIGTTALEMTEWVEFWQQTVTAMRSVPRSSFRFDWCVNNGYRDIPFNDYYPGDKYVDIIGDDVYDLGSGSGASAWPSILSQPGGLSDVIAFASAHDKPISIPEWGEGLASDGQGGDDPAYIDGMANVIKENDVAYQSYFFAHEWAAQLEDGPLSLAAYRQHFGDGGDSVGADDNTSPSQPTRSPPTQTSPPSASPPNVALAPAKPSPRRPAPWVIRVARERSSERKARQHRFDGPKRRHGRGGPRRRISLPA